jgi:hypothetical protein
MAFRSRQRAHGGGKFKSERQRRSADTCGRLFRRPQNDGRMVAGRGSPTGEGVVELEMLPSARSTSTLNGRAVNVIPRGQNLRGFATGPNGGDISVGEPTQVLVLALGLASLSNAVMPVLCACAEEQVRGIEARRVVAAMQNIDPARNGTNPFVIGEAMDTPEGSIAADCAMAEMQLVACPFPASISSDDALGEHFGDGDGACICRAAHSGHSTKDGGQDR